MKKLQLALLVLIILVISSTVFFYQKNKQTIKILDTSQTTEKTIDSVVEANNQFALDLYKKYKTKDGNIFFSPYSLSSALVMTYEGAKGETAEEIQTVFHFPKDDLARRSGYAGLYNQINQTDKKYKLNTANALWADQSFQLLDQYSNLIDQFYGGKVTNLDFKQKADESRETINNWVEDQTNNKIKNLIPAGFIDKLTRLVLTNAVYFKGSWLNEFDEDYTLDQDFQITKNNQVKVKMMHKNDSQEKYNYSENSQMQILEMPYAGEELSMLFILPKNNDLESVENSLSRENLDAWKNNFRKQNVNIFIPRFKFETKYFLANDLAEMGMPTAFEDMADFSGLSDKNKLAISQVIHQAFVEVNEEGTEAAAATAVIIKASMSSGDFKPPAIPIFKADHPFIFLIQQNDSGNILFLGRVTNPEQ